MYRNLEPVLRRGCPAFCFLCFSQFIMQLEVLACIRTDIKSASFFEMVEDNRFLFNIRWIQRKESLAFDLGGFLGYLLPGDNARILFIPWILNGFINWINTTYFFSRSAFIAYATNDFFYTIMIMLIILSVKTLLIYEVFMKVWEGLRKFNWHQNDSMAVVLWKGDPGANSNNLDRSFGEPAHISDDEDF